MRGCEPEGVRPWKLHLDPQFHPTTAANASGSGRFCTGENLGCLSAPGTLLSFDGLVHSITHIKKFCATGGLYLNNLFAPASMELYYIW